MKLFGDYDFPFNVQDISVPELNLQDLFYDHQQLEYLHSGPEDSGSTLQAFETPGPEIQLDVRIFNSDTAPRIPNQTSPQTLEKNAPTCDNWSSNAKPDDPVTQEVINRGEQNWRDSMIVFSVKSGNQVLQKRRRKAFVPLRRKEVAMSRLIGACT